MSSPEREPQLGKSEISRDLPGATPSEGDESKSAKPKRRVRVLGMGIDRKFVVDEEGVASIEGSQKPVLKEMEFEEIEDDEP